MVDFPLKRHETMLNMHRIYNCVGLAGHIDVSDTAVMFSEYLEHCFKRNNFSFRPTAFRFIAHFRKIMKTK